jgi:hypothetical protein
MTGLSAETVGVHFVASYRGKLAEFSDMPECAAGKAPVEIKAACAQLSFPHRMLLQDLRNRF